MFLRKGRVGIEYMSSKEPFNVPIFYYLYPNQTTVVQFSKFSIQNNMLILVDVVVSFETKDNRRVIEFIPVLKESHTDKNLVYFEKGKTGKYFVIPKSVVDDFKNLYFGSELA
jgi:hypothetical protein